MPDREETHLSQQVGEYRLLRKLGRGTFGTVYLAEHVREHTQAAVKILRIAPSNNEDFKRFVSEASIMRLRHPHIHRNLHATMIHPARDRDTSQRYEMPFSENTAIPTQERTKLERTKGHKICYIQRGTNPADLLGCLHPTFSWPSLAGKWAPHKIRRLV